MLNLDFCVHGYQNIISSYRWLGRSRYSLSGVRTFLANKSYPGMAKSGEIELEKDDLINNIYHLSYVAEDEAGLLGAECGEGCPTCHTCSDPGTRSGEREGA